MRVSVLSVFLTIAALAAYGPAQADTPEYVECVRTKVRDAASAGQGVDLTAIRALCRHIYGDGVEIKQPDTLSGGANNRGTSGQAVDGCQDYAADAAEKAAFAVQNCGLSGPRYAPYEDDHRNWCKTARADWVDSERKARNEEIEACKLCRMYVERTEIQFGKRRMCLSSVGGPLWTPNPADVHFNFCMVRESGKNIRVNQEVFSMSGQRDVDLNACMQAPVMR